MMFLNATSRNNISIGGVEGVKPPNVKYNLNFDPQKRPKIGGILYILFNASLSVYLGI